MAESENNVSDNNPGMSPDWKTRFMETVFQSVPSMLISTDNAGIVTHWNRAIGKFTGVSSEEAEGKMFWEKVPFLEAYKEKFAEVMESGRGERFSMVEVPGDDISYLDISINPLIEGEERGAVIQIEDMTESHRKDEYVRQAQKMDTVGTLASGIAHDFNNVIGAIKGTVSSIKYSIMLDRGNVEKLIQDIEKDLTLIEDSAKHGEEMVDQLKSLARKKEKDFTTVDLIKVVENVLRICRKTFPESIHISGPDEDYQTALVKAFPTQLDQMLLNLCVNASHAMTIMKKEGEQQGGTMSLSLDRVSPGRHFSSILPGASAGDYWLIRLMDTGVGMSQDVLSKIFDPFFTTKGKDVGTGLGLSMVYNIAQNHKGFIEVYSEPDNGSIFNVFLPVSDEQPPEEAVPASKMENSQNQPEPVRSPLIQRDSGRPQLTVKFKKRF